MANKTIYIKEEDIPLYERIAASDGESLSSQFAEFLRSRERLSIFDSPSGKIEYTDPAMTLRDQFAMVALEGGFKCDPTNFYYTEHKDRIAMAAKAYDWADAIFEARNKEK